jgi:hypothetical protein
MGKKAIFEVAIPEISTQIFIRHQITNSGISENNKQNKCHKIAPRFIILKLEAIKD